MVKSANSGGAAPHGVPVVELVHRAEPVVGFIDKTKTEIDFGVLGAKVISGSEAFRKFDGLSQTAGLNAAGNLRGMVVSGRWSTVFRHLSTFEEASKNLGYYAAIAAGIAESAPQISAVAKSSDSVAVKGMRMSVIASTISQRVLLGSIPFGVHLIYTSLEGYFGLAGLMGATQTSAKGIEVLKSADTLVQTTFKTITDANWQGQQVWTVIDFVTTPRAAGR